MAVLKTRNIKKALEKKGFREDKKQGNTDHHYYRLYTSDGIKTSITTKISRGEKEIYDPLIKAMGKQIGLSTRDFKAYVRCDLSKNKYYKKLIRKNKIKL